VELDQIAYVESPLRDRAAAPKQGNEGAPEAWLVFDERVAAGLDGLRTGDDVFVLTWLHQSRRDALRVHPRDDRSNAERGVFTTRSPERPNPIGLHRVRILRIDGLRVQVQNPEAIDGTPIVDLKPVIDADRRGDGDRRVIRWRDGHATFAAWTSSVSTTCRLPLQRVASRTPAASSASSSG
jgi:tRNA-Thr(GGU) m(6)t(6)A37 methyltransferase TsaA